VKKTFFVNCDLFFLVGNTTVELNPYFFDHLLALPLPPVDLGFVVMAGSHDLRDLNFLLGVQPNLGLLLEAFVEVDDFLLGWCAVVVGDRGLPEVDSLQSSSGVDNPTFDLSDPLSFLNFKFFEITVTESGDFNDES